MSERMRSGAGRCSGRGRTGGCYILEAPIFIFLLLTNTLPSHDLFPPPFHHMTLSPDRSPIILTM